MIASRFLPLEPPPPPDRVRADILVTAATPMELSWAVAEGPPLRWGAWGKLRAAFLVTGPGPTAAAYALGRISERLAADLYLSVGVGGSLPRSCLEPGDLAVATEEIDADLGVEPDDEGRRPDPIHLAPEGFGPETLLTRFEASTPHLPLLMSAARSEAEVIQGPFVTSALVTASVARAELLSTLYGAVCETMEGAAVARAATAAGAAFAEVRGISNLVGPRDRSSWRIREAALATGVAAIGFLNRLEASR